MCGYCNLFIILLLFKHCSRRHLTRKRKHDLCLLKINFLAVILIATTSEQKQWMQFSSFGTQVLCLCISAETLAFSPFLSQKMLFLISEYKVVWHLAIEHNFFAVLCTTSYGETCVFSHGLFFNFLSFFFVFYSTNLRKERHCCSFKPWQNEETCR